MGPLAPPGQFRILEKQRLTDLGLGEEARGAEGLAVTARGLPEEWAAEHRQCHPQTRSTCHRDRGLRSGSQSQTTGRTCRQSLPPGRTNVPLLE